MARFSRTATTRFWSITKDVVNFRADRGCALKHLGGKCWLSTTSPSLKIRWSSKETRFEKPNNCSGSSISVHQGFNRGWGWGDWPKLAFADKFDVSCAGFAIWREQRTFQKLWFQFVLIAGNINVEVALNLDEVLVSSVWSPEFFCKFPDIHCCFAFSLSS